MKTTNQYVYYVADTDELITLDQAPPNRTKPLKFTIVDKVTGEEIIETTLALYFVGDL